MHKRIDLTDAHFGKLHVIKEAGTAGFWLCHCDCGNNVTVRGGSLRSGNTKSCGCKRFTNVGRPKQPNIEGIVPFGPFLDANLPHIHALRNYLKDEYQIKVTGDGRFSVDHVSYGPFASPVHALAEALRRVVGRP
jgi:hypothetical protein